jgi:hypothetical protein
MEGCGGCLCFNVDGKARNCTAKTDGGSFAPSATTGAFFCDAGILNGIDLTASFQAAAAAAADLRCRRCSCAKP